MFMGVIAHFYWLKRTNCKLLRCIILNYTPASEASRELANLTWRKNSNTPVYGVKELDYLSVCLSVSLSVDKFYLKYTNSVKNPLTRRENVKNVFKIESSYLLLALEDCPLGIALCGSVRFVLLKFYFENYSFV